MTLFRAPLLAVLVFAAFGGVAQAREPAARDGAAFDRLFEQLDNNRLKPATPEESKADVARLRALLPPNDERRQLKYRFISCVQPPEDAHASLEFARAALEQARASGDLESQSRFLFCRAMFEERVTGGRNALPLYDEGIALAQRVERPQLVGDGLVMRGNVHSFLGEHALALMDFIHAQRIYESARLQDSADANLQNIAVAYRRMGEFDKARQYLDQSRAIALRQQDWNSLLDYWLQSGFLHEDLKQPQKALGDYAEALRITHRRMGTGDVGCVYLAMGSAHVALGRHQSALDDLDLARADFAAVKDDSNEGMIGLVEGQARAGLGQREPALAAFERGEKVLLTEGNDRYLAMLYPERARLYEAMGNERLALQDYKHYLALREKLQDANSDQRGLMLRQQFDASRRELDNQRLRTEKALRDQEVQAMLKARRWQWGALALGVALSLVLGALVARQLVRTRRLRVLALTDELTGVANRRRIELIGEDAIAQAHADGRALSLVTFDIDLFKRINDSHGHLAGDQVIARVADACRAALRQFDEIGRTGGEEFLVILPDTPREAAQQVAERLRTSVEGLRWDDVTPDLRVTVSLGIASLSAGDSSLRELLARADAALYAAKAAGRNRLETA